MPQKPPISPDATSCSLPAHLFVDQVSDMDGQNSARSRDGYKADSLQKDCIIAYVRLASRDVETAQPIAKLPEAALAFHFL
jgi:hypothetical protein